MTDNTNNHAEVFEEMKKDRGSILEEMKKDALNTLGGPNFNYHAEQSGHDVARENLKYAERGLKQLANGKTLESEVSALLNLNTEDRQKYYQTVFKEGGHQATDELRNRAEVLEELRKDRTRIMGEWAKESREGMKFPSEERQMGYEGLPTGTKEKLVEEAKKVYAAHLPSSDERYEYMKEVIRTRGDRIGALLQDEIENVGLRLDCSRGKEIAEERERWKKIELRSSAKHILGLPSEKRRALYMDVQKKEGKQVALDLINEVKRQRGIKERNQGMEI